MKILKPGDPRKAAAAEKSSKYRGTCYVCGCRLECEREELTNALGLSGVCRCPTEGCGCQVVVEMVGAGEN